MGHRTWTVTTVSRSIWFSPQGIRRDTFWKRGLVITIRASLFVARIRRTVLFSGGIQDYVAYWWAVPSKAPRR
jgi:hypothetical protein